MFLTKFYLEMRGRDADRAEGIPTFVPFEEYLCPFHRQQRQNSRMQKSWLDYKLVVFEQNARFRSRQNLLRVFLDSF